jgi:hypothetical protein
VPCGGRSSRCASTSHGYAAATPFSLSLILYLTPRERRMLVALALTEQLLPLGETVPHTPTDERVDVVLCADADACVYATLPGP